MNNPFTKQTGLPYTVHINRRLARLISPKVKKSTPNQITFWGFCVLLAALALILIYAGTIWIVFAYLLLAFNYVLDSVDGQVARLRNMSSPLGEWLDHSLDGLRMILLHLAFAYVIFTHTDGETLSIGLIAFAANITFMTSNYFFSILKDKILQQRTGDQLQGFKGIKKTLVMVFSFPADYGIYIMITLFLIRVEYFVWVYFLYGVYFLFLFSANFILTIRQNIK